MIAAMYDPENVVQHQHISGSILEYHIHNCLLIRVIGTSNHICAFLSLSRTWWYPMTTFRATHFTCMDRNFWLERNLGAMVTARNFWPQRNVGHQNTSYLHSEEKCLLIVNLLPPIIRLLIIEQIYIQNWLTLSLKGNWSDNYPCLRIWTNYYRKTCFMQVFIMLHLCCTDTPRGWCIRIRYVSDTDTL